MSNELMNGSKKRNTEEHVRSGAPLSDPKRLCRRKGGRAITVAWLGSLIGMLVLASLPAQAALITINETMDISKPSEWYRFLPTTPHVLAPGDSVNMTVNFLPGQALKISDFHWSWSHDYSWSVEFFSAALMVDTNTSSTVENAVVTFLGFSGTGGASSTLTSARSEMAGYVSAAVFADFLSAGQSIQFTGYNVTYEVTRLTNWNPNPGYPAGTSSYSGIGFLAFTEAVVSVPVPEAVPEPGALSLLVIGLAGLAVAQCKKVGPARGVYPA